MLVQTRTKVLRDGPRPVAYKYTSPVRSYEFIRIPGRPGGSTPEEAMLSPQKGVNTGWKQILENRALCANPQKVYDKGSGLTADMMDNRPGRQYGANPRPHVKPVEWIVPPAMGADVWRAQEALIRELGVLGSTQGTESQQVSDDASGELIKELRFNDDRFLGPTMRRSSEENGRLLEDWMVLLPAVYSTETILKYTGDDNVARAIVLMPDILTGGKVDVVPDMESMLPEGRGERRSRVYKMWLDGAFGPKDSPEALRQLHELSKFPHMNRTSKPGGVHWTTAEQENGELLNGVDPLTIPVYEWYNHDIHIVVIEEFMSTPEWKRLPDEVKIGFVVHRDRHLVEREKKLLEAQMKIAQADALMNPGGGPGGGGGGGKPPSPGKPMGGGPATPPASQPIAPTSAGVK